MDAYERSGLPDVQPDEPFFDVFTENLCPGDNTWLDACFMNIDVAIQTSAELLPFVLPAFGFRHKSISVQTTEVGTSTSTALLVEVEEKPKKSLKRARKSPDATSSQPLQPSSSSATATAPAAPQLTPAEQFIASLDAANNKPTPSPAAAPAAAPAVAAAATEPPKKRQRRAPSKSAARAEAGAASTAASTPEMQMSNPEAPGLPTPATVVPPLPSSPPKRRKKSVAQAAPVRGRGISASSSSDEFDVSPVKEVRRMRAQSTELGPEESDEDAAAAAAASGGSGGGAGVDEDLGWLKNPVQVPSSALLVIPPPKAASNGAAVPGGVREGLAQPSISSSAKSPAKAPPASTGKASGSRAAKAAEKAAAAAAAPTASAGESGDEAEKGGESMRFTGPVLAVETSATAAEKDAVLQAVKDLLPTKGMRDAVRCCYADAENGRFLLAMRNNKHSKGLSFEDDETVLIQDKLCPIRMLGEEDRKDALKTLRLIHKTAATQ